MVRFKVTPDVLFGQGKVLKDGKEAMKDLFMDVYYPIEESSDPRPAIILTYGGSFHRGNPRVPYVGIGSQSTTMSQYAMRYVEEGYVCFTISYRVAPDNPVIGPYEGIGEDELIVEKVIEHLNMVYKKAEITMNYHIQEKDKTKEEVKMNYKSKENIEATTETVTIDYITKDLPNDEQVHGGIKQKTLF